MRRLLIYTLALAALIISGNGWASRQAFAQQSAVAAGSMSPAEIQKIVSTFSSRETQFRRALNEYGFKRDAVVQIIGMGGEIAGEYHRVSQFSFDDSGNRFEKIIFFPMPSYAGVTPEDIEDLGGVNQFALEASKIDQYNFTYVGKERIDELNLYVFDVSPKVVPDPKKSKDRFFVGRIWVDDHDLQIVKSRGKGTPETKNNKFPVVETYREQVDGRYWFPTYSYADDELVFGNGEVLHIRLKVTYSEHKKGHVDIRITEVDDDGSDPSKAQSTPSTTPLTNSQVSGSILNSKAKELPAPLYPADAKAKHLTGTVKVQVTVDEEGNVSAAEAVEGPKELREAAVAAAKKARFEPVKLHGQAIKIEGYLVYKFE